MCVIAGGKTLMSKWISGRRCSFLGDTENVKFFFEKRPKTSNFTLRLAQMMKGYNNSVGGVYIMSTTRLTKERNEEEWYKRTKKDDNAGMKQKRGEEGGGGESQTEGSN